MKTKECLKNILTLLQMTARRGNTTGLIDAADYHRGFLVLSNKKLQEELKNVSSVCISDRFEGKTFEGPVFFDNRTIEDLCSMALKEIEKLEKELKKDVKIQDCPFCGAKSTVYEFLMDNDPKYIISAKHDENCPFFGRITQMYATSKKCIEAWNGRLEK